MPGASPGYFAPVPRSLSSYAVRFLFVTTQGPRAYIRIAVVLRHRIMRGEPDGGMPVPSITIAREFGVGARTAGRALRLLETEGLVRRIPGLEYCVTDQAARVEGPARQSGLRASPG